eukprot:CAMPEP_0194354590 /NCGR_PEP_ID=MMETSP0174-20130528/2712_1 /TAXON_ID=216777 /ORGANISM="Proboscia alata, Strain PI-D3" /LENGTH=656 /DNA_ID=CAMNT_0039123593 /DNA_START=158 /DNA_END=2128 /DNA_ORIENTATION=+
MSSSSRMSLSSPLLLLLMLRMQTFLLATSFSSPPSSRATVSSRLFGTRITSPTEPIEGMRPGTSGLRKKTNVWSDTPHYVENFIQSILNVAMNAPDGTDTTKPGQTMIVAGDGRYYNTPAIQTMIQILAGNDISEIWIPRHGIMSTPAVSAAIRRRVPDTCGKDGDGVAMGGIVLTASHNPGGPTEDFGIKYNEGLGQPAGEEFTEAVYKESLAITSYKTISEYNEVDLSAPVGTQYAVTPTCTVTIIDPFEDYVNCLRECFDFDKLKRFSSDSKKGFRMLYDGMHGAGGPFAKRVLVEELGLPESSLMRCNPLPDFGGCHPDPNLTYAAELVSKMGLNPDGSPSTTTDLSTLPTLGAANDGDGDRNLIAGAGCFVTPSDSMAMILAHYRSIPHFSKNGGRPRGVARSMPSSAALDVVADAMGIPCFVTPTGWKFFGNLMSSVELFDGIDYSPFLCGEESFGTGSDHIREKDGLWAVLAWMSILMEANAGFDDLRIGVKDLTTEHWKTYGRHFYCRYDYEGVDSDQANTMMDQIRTNFVEGSPPEDGATPSSSGIEFVDGVEFSYTDPVDQSIATNQGLILNFKYTANGNPARVVFRLSGTGSAGATIRMYLERFEGDASLHDEAAPVALLGLATKALELVKMKEITGRDSPTVIT